MADAAEAKMQEFLRLHQAQLEGARVPQHLWPVVYYKLQRELLDAGDYFFLARDEDGDLHAVVRDDVDLAPVQPDSELALFVVDHAWTFTADKMQEQLAHTPSLLERMESLMQLSPVDDHEAPLPKEQRMGGVMERVWKYANTYRIGNLRPEEQSAIWYVMDEFGSAIEHSDSPNMRMAPFYFAETQCAFSLLWPIEPLEAGGFLARDYVPEQTQDADTRAALLAALFYPPEQNTLVDEQEYMQQLFQAVTRRRQEYSLEGARAKFHAIVSRDSEVLPDPVTTTAEPPLAVAISGSSPLQVYSNHSLVYEHLKHPRFEHLESEEGAQVVWPTWHIKDFQKYAADERVQIINQFPNEKILTCKDLLYEMCKLQNGGERPVWLAETYNMTSEFPELIAEYIHRSQLAWSEGEKEDEANHWICKPWNMARSIDTCIAQNAPHLARLTETGPKVACKYIHRPLLIDERKFDFRFLVMVKSTEPLELYLSGVSWLRIANTPFSMDNFQDFQKHFTVMNYSDFGVRIMDNTEFVQRFEDEYPSEDWPRVHAEICASIKQLFTFATAQPPPLGLGRCSKSRGLYGVDVMLSWETNEETGEEFIRPVILEVNFQPDCTRACKFFPSFYNDLMNVLVLDKADDVVHGVTKL